MTATIEMDRDELTNRYGLGIAEEIIKRGVEPAPRPMNPELGADFGPRNGGMVR